MKETLLPSLNTICRTLIPSVGSKNNGNKNTKTKMNSVNKNTCKKKEMYRINLRKYANANTRDFILVRFVWPTSSPKHSAWDFPYPDFDTPQNQLLVHHLTKHPLSNLYNSSLHQEDTFLYNYFLHQEDTFLYNSSLWLIIKYPISLETCMDCEQGLL